MRSPRGRLLLVAAVAVVVLVVGYAGYAYLRLTRGITTSDVLAAGGTPTTGSAHGDTNLLVMGLDSRVDENGDPLPADIYEALHAGDANDGGLQRQRADAAAPPRRRQQGHGRSPSRATTTSTLPGCPDRQCKGKIKQAYGLAYDQRIRDCWPRTRPDPATREQKPATRAARPRSTTVSQFLGVPVDHFVEVTMVAFYQIAQVVQPITVCVKEDDPGLVLRRELPCGPTADRRRAGRRLRAPAPRPPRSATTSPTSTASVASRRSSPRWPPAEAGRHPRQPGEAAAGSSTSPSRTRRSTPDSTCCRSPRTPRGLAGGNVTFYTLPIKAFGKDPARRGRQHRRRPPDPGHRHAAPQPAVDLLDLGPGGDHRDTRSERADDGGGHRDAGADGPDRDQGGGIPCVK